MAVHYAVARIKGAITGVALGAIEFTTPVTGQLKKLRLQIAAANAEGDTLFDVKVNGASVYASPVDRPKILAGQTSTTTFPTIDLDEGDLLSVDVVSAPLGGITGLATMLRLQDAALRSTVVFITTSLNDGQTANFDIPDMGTGWKLLGASADRACWVRGYISAAARTADAGRLITDDAGENAGLCCEIIFTASLLTLGYGAPFPEGFNLDDPESDHGIFAVTNRSGAAHTIQLTFERLITEA
jgi:hypothetical protein